jgi:hypothetical protein
MISDQHEALSLKGEPTMTRHSTLGLALIVAMLLLGLCATAQADETRGKLIGVYPDRHTFIVTSADSKARMMTFDLDRNGKVFINNREASLMELQVGQDVLVIFEMQMDRPVAVEVRAGRD